MSRAPRLCVLLSGSGRTLQNLIDRIAAGTLRAEIVGVLADRADRYGLQRATNARLPTGVEREPAAIWRWLRQQRPDLICLCGWLRLLPIAADFRDRVLNIHPSLLPAFGGKGMFGHHVHAAVLAAGATESGCTVHLCTDEYDRGPILVQKRVPVLPGDDADQLAARVFAAECEAYPEAITRHWANVASTG